MTFLRVSNLPADVKRDLMEILCCPVHKTDLTLTVAKEDEREIIEGSLFCKTCDFRYPIEDGIPNLLPPELQQERKV